MLSTVIPGLREIRAPLAAGYVWLVAIWIMAERRIPERDQASEIVQSLFRLIDGLAAVGTGIIVTFSAYLVGIALDGLRLDRLRRFRPWGRLRAPGQYPYFVAWRSENPTRQYEIFFGHRAGGNFTLKKDTAVALEKILSDEYRKIERGEDHPSSNQEYSRFPNVEATLRNGYWLDDVFAGPPGGDRTDDIPWVNPPEIDVLRHTAVELLREDPIIETQLITDAPNYYQEVNRIKAEAEFRFALATPLAVVILLLAVQLEWVLLVGLVVPAVLWKQGSDRVALGRDRVIHGIESGLVKSRPRALERLESALDSVWGNLS